MKKTMMMIEIVYRGWRMVSVTVEGDSGMM